MSDALYEQYKEALRRGHVAVRGARLDEALDAYGEAARLAPDRALPLAGIGSVLARLGKYPEALTAFDTALDRAPSDESALRGRTDALLAIGDRSRAAETLDRLAAALDAAGRPAEALEAAGRALDLAESRSRRASLAAMVGRLEGGDASETAAPEVERARRLLRGPVSDLAEPDVPTEPPPPPFDPTAAIDAVELAAARGDGPATRDLALEAARGLRAAGQLHAAIDACYLALATNPSDTELHLALAEIYLDRGWKAVAGDKLVLLARLLDLDGDASARQQLCGLAARLPDDPRLAEVCP
jgi:tetratricopeptide (TPR) repeat protein